MQRMNIVITTIVWLFLQKIHVALAHEHDPSSHMDMEGAGGWKGAKSIEMVGNHTYAILNNDSEVELFPSYWRHPEHTSIMYAHITLTIIAWFLVLPPAVMLSIARSRLTIPTQLLFHLLNGLATFAGVIYSVNTPQLYPNKSHRNAGWIISAIAAVWTIMSVLKLYGHAGEETSQSSVRRLISHAAMMEHHRLHESPAKRWSSDSGQGSERNTTSLFSSSRANSWQSEMENISSPYRDTGDDEDEGLLNNEKVHERDSPNRLERLLASAVPQFPLGRFEKSFTIIYIIFERCLAPLAFCAIVSGIVVYSGIFRGKAIFSGLAHFIKGGIFFWYGILSLGRWMGCFSEFGWAWNLKPSAKIVGKSMARVPSAEFTESFVIFFYGASNVFLEHLAGWGKEWSMMDFEHISITILFFGGGLLGMLIESKRIRDLFNRTITSSEPPNVDQFPRWIIPKTYLHPLNPLPALVIMLLGIMMSSHHQHSSIGAAIHKQWGYLFILFAAARLVTYVALWSNPPESYLPSRPPTELVASFSLVGGGLIFMASNSSTVNAIELLGLDTMFIFTVVMGLTAMIMAWALSMVAIKAWAAERELRKNAQDLDHLQSRRK